MRGHLTPEAYEKIVEFVGRGLLPEQLKTDTVAVFQSATDAYFAGNHEVAHRLLERESVEVIFDKDPRNGKTTIAFQVLSLALICHFGYRGLAGDLSGVRGRIPSVSPIDAERYWRPFTRYAGAALFHISHGKWAAGESRLPHKYLGTNGIEAARVHLLDNLPRNLERPVSFGESDVSVPWRVLSGGLFSPTDLRELGFARENVRAGFHPGSELRPVKMAFLGGWRFNEYSDGHFYLMTSASWQLLEILKRFDSLDLVDGDAIAKEIGALQVLEGKTLSPHVDQEISRMAINGLFLTEQLLMQENWICIRILSALGRLDAIDRDAFVERLKWLHRGRGKFRAPWPFRVISAYGYADTTFHALDCLLLLGEIDTVEDIANWEFRVSENMFGSESQVLTVKDVIAAIYQDRLTEIVRSGKVPPTFFPE